MIDLQSTIDDAWEFLTEGEAAHAAELARGALNHHPDTIDAYVVLAAACDVPGEAIALLREGVRIGGEVKSAKRDRQYGRGDVGRPWPTCSGS